MSGELKQYAQYKDSGVEWLGEVPEHWELERAKWLFRRVFREVREQDDVVTCFRDGTVTLRKNRRTEGFTNSLKEIGYQGVRVGDLVIHAMDAFAGAIGVSDSEGKATPVYSVCVPRTAGRVDTDYYAHYLRNLAVRGFIVSLAKGVRERSTDFRFAEFSAVHLPVPPLLEQHAIADYLHAETGRIDTLISEQRELIELLKEKRQALISHCVTRGLDPEVPMKDSGVEWLGEVPEHWEVTKSKSFCDVRDGTHDTPQYVEASEKAFPFVTTQDISGGEISFENVKYISKEDHERFSKRSRVEDGDIVMPMIGSIGGAIVVKTDREFSIKNIALFKKAPSYDTGWFQYLLNSSLVSTQFDLERAGGVQSFVGLSILRNLVAPLPPLPEQRAIADYLDSESSRIDGLIKEAEETITLMQEHRSALISACVTGKVKVPGVADPAAEEQAV